MSTQTMVCINCPRGCTMTVTKEGDDIKVTGNFCKKGEQFAINELTCPMRTICTTVKTAFSQVPVIPCRVSNDIPKDRIFDVMKEINGVIVEKPIGRGDVIIKDVLGTGADIIATSDVLKQTVKVPKEEKTEKKEKAVKTPVKKVSGKNKPSGKQNRKPNNKKTDNNKQSKKKEN